MTAHTRIAELEHAIEALKARLPKHSTPPAMIVELEDLEEELAALMESAGDGSDRSDRPMASTADIQSSGALGQDS